MLSFIDMYRAYSYVITGAILAQATLARFPTRPPGKTLGGGRAVALPPTRGVWMAAARSSCLPLPVASTAWSGSDHRMDGSLSL